MVYEQRSYDKHFYKPSNSVGYTQFYKFQNLNEEQKKILEAIQKENFENTKIDWMDHAPYIKIKNLKVSELHDGTRQYINYPDKIGQLRTLRKLILKGFEAGKFGGGIKKIPETIFELKKLEYLDLSLNNIKEVPESIGQLKILKHLDLGGNQIYDIPSSIAELTSLEKLNLGVNKLRTLPISFEHMASLQVLFLNSNQLTSIPKSIFKLKNLHTLFLNTNKITSISRLIGNLNNLKTLDLSFNRGIKSLPDSIGNLNSLKKLNLRGNPLIQLPQSLNKLSSLKELNLGNRFLEKNFNCQTREILESLKKNGVIFKPPI